MALRAAMTSASATDFGVSQAVDVAAKNANRALVLSDAADNALPAGVLLTGFIFSAQCCQSVPWHCACTGLYRLAIAAHRGLRWKERQSLAV